MDGYSSEEAATLLGIKRSTLYVYVSRGLIASHRDDRGRSVFDAEEIDGLVRRRQSSTSAEAPFGKVATNLTELTDRGPKYAGQYAVDLVDRDFEEVAQLLWGRAVASWEPIVGLPAFPSLSEMDQLRTTVIYAGSADILPSDLRPCPVRRAGARLAATIAQASQGGESRAPGRLIARSLCCSLGQRQPSDEVINAANALLVLLADGGLATSTLAVRLAASARANLYDAVLAGLGVLGGPLHISGGQLALEFFERCRARGAGRAVDDFLRWNRALPGFGSETYPEGDPRFVAFLPYINSMLDNERKHVLHDLLSVAAAHDFPYPNYDLAIALFLAGTGASDDAGVRIFVLARLAGWVGHYLEELGETQSRFRPGPVVSGGPGAGS